MFLKKYRVKNKYGPEIEAHEVFLDKMAKQRDEDSGFSEKRLEIPLKERKAYFLFGIACLLAIVLFGKTFYLQIFQGQNLFVSAENNKGKIALLRPERGIIYDRNMKKMATNSASFDLVCDVRKFPVSSQETLGEIVKISDIMGKDFSELENIISQANGPEIVVAENLSHETMLAIQARLPELIGCKIESNTVRNYILGQAFAHVLGYMGRVGERELQSSAKYAHHDSAGKTGLENYYENYLRGVPGIVETERTAVGVQKGQKILSEPEPGKNMVLNIDVDLQQKVYEELEKSLKKIGSEKGAAVAINPKDGSVLAMVSYPSFDNNIFSKSISKKDLDSLFASNLQPFFNRAVSARYPTGSTIKPLEAAAALQENLISPEKIINDPGYIEIQSKYDPSVVYRFGGVKPHGLVNMRKAIAVSSNIYFYTVGGGYEDQKGLGPTRIKKYLELFGWGEKTGIDLPGEFQGFIPSPEWKKAQKNESWWDGDTYNLSIGQSDLQTTPLQLASAYCAIANGGTLYKPQIAKEIIGVKKFEPEVIRQSFIDSENLQIVREGMRDAVQKSYGSSFMLNSLPVPVASKTGTAEISKQNHYNTWIATFAPYENPKIVLVVTIEDVEGLQSATLPVAYNVLDWYFKR